MDLDLVTEYLDRFSSFMDTVLFTMGEQQLTVGHLVVVPLTVVFGFLLVRWTVRLVANRLTARNVGPDVVHLVQRLLYIVGIAVLAITILDMINVPLTAFAFVSGAIAIGVGFGAQNIINNFISGWILMWERPIKIGDFLEVGDTKGTVESINTRSTRIRRVDGVHLLVPNSHLLENTVVNWTLVDRLARSTVRVGVAYGSPVRKVAELIEQAASEQEEVLDDPAPAVFFEDFGDSALIFDVYYWMQASADRDLRRTRSNVRFRIDDLFNEAGIVISFPQRDVHIDGAVQILQPTTAEGTKPD